MGFITNKMAKAQGGWKDSKLVPFPEDKVFKFQVPRASGSIQVLRGFSAYPQYVYLSRQDIHIEGINLAPKICGWVHPQYVYLYRQDIHIEGIKRCCEKVHPPNPQPESTALLDSTGEPGYLKTSPDFSNKNCVLCIPFFKLTLRIWYDNDKM